MARSVQLSMPPVSAGREPSGWPRIRVAVALVGTVVGFGLIPFGVLSVVTAMPLIGVMMAGGTPPDTTPEARPVAFTRRNVLLGVGGLAATAVVILQSRLTAPLIGVFGVSWYGVVFVLLGCVALAIPLALREAAERISDLAPGRMNLTRRGLALAMTVVITTASWYNGPGQSSVAVGAAVLVLPLALAAFRIRHARRHRLDTRLLRHPLAAGLWPYRLRALNLLILCALLVTITVPHTFDLLWLNQRPGTIRGLQIMYGVGVVVLAALAFIPLRRLSAAANALVAVGSIFLTMQVAMVYRPPVDAVVIASPLAGPLYVGHGGRAELVNYHHVGAAQRNAVDFLQVVDGRSYAGDSKDLRSYYIFGKPMLAAADGVVTAVVGNLPDQRIGSADPENAAGNSVVIDIGGGRYVMAGHMRQASVRVAVGQRVRAGQVIGQVGNSGNTSEPHIHLQVQDQPAFDTRHPAEFLRRIHTYPMLFRDVVLTRDGTTTAPAAADIRRGDVISPR